MRVQFMGGEDPLEKEVTTHSNIAWKIDGQRSLVGCSPWGRKEEYTTGCASMYKHTHVCAHTHTSSGFRKQDLRLGNRALMLVCNQ